MSLWNKVGGLPKLCSLTRHEIHAAATKPELGRSLVPIILCEFACVCVCLHVCVCVCVWACVCVTSRGLSSGGQTDG